MRIPRNRASRDSPVVFYKAAWISLIGPSRPTSPIYSMLSSMSSAGLDGDIFPKYFSSTATTRMRTCSTTARCSWPSRITHEHRKSVGNLNQAARLHTRESAEYRRHISIRLAKPASDPYSMPAWQAVQKLLRPAGALRWPKVQAHPDQTGLLQIERNAANGMRQWRQTDPAHSQQPQAGAGTQDEQDHLGALTAKRHPHRDLL